MPCHQDHTVLISLVQLFAPNFYSFFADALARLVIALDTLSVAERAAVRVALPSSGGVLRPFMWPLLELLGIRKTNSYPYPIRPFSATLTAVSAARLRVRRLLVVDWWSPTGSAVAPRGMLTADSAAADGANHAVEMAHLPARYALRMLRSTLRAALGVAASITFHAPSRVLVYLQRGGAAARRLGNEVQLLEALGPVHCMQL